MTFRHGTHRADSEPGEDSQPHNKPLNADAYTDGTTNGPPQPTADQHREWRRWIVETFLTADYGVVPVDHLVDAILDREPEDVDRSTVRAALTETVLPQLDHDAVFDYDADRELLINYGD